MAWKGGRCNMNGWNGGIDTRQNGLRAIMMGLVLVMAGLLLRIAAASPSASGTPPVPSPKAMSRAITVPLSRMGPRDADYYTFVGQLVHSVGGFGTRYATYATVVARQGHILYWGDGMASWGTGQTRPDVNLTAYPINEPGSVYRLLNKPSASVVRYTPGAPVPRAGVVWYELLTPGHRVILAVAPTHGVWIFAGGRTGRLSPVMGPPTFGP